MNFSEIALQIKENVQTIVLIYAFNSTGKTKLSVEYKNLTKNTETNEHAGTYYNAFSEDLFVWDNDEDNKNANIQLNILFSSLSQYHSLIDKDNLEENLQSYNTQFKFKLNEDENLERGYKSVSFFLETEQGEQVIKISRGEERIFVWCFFLALFEVDAWSGQQDAHLFIDDPVSSLDDHNIFITADSILDIISNTNLKKKKIIITTHHIGLFSILYDRLKRGEKSSSFKELTSTYMLKKQDGALSLKKFEKEVFLYHLHLLQILDDAIKTELFNYHFVLLRQLLEIISSFFGVSRIKFVLEQIEIDKAEEIVALINSLSHKNVYKTEFYKMNEAEEIVFKDIFDRIQKKYNFIY